MKENAPDNIYIIAMMIGYSNNEGIQYPMMKELIQSRMNIPFEGEREFTFIKWFLKNFDARRDFLNDDNLMTAITHGVFYKDSLNYIIKKDLETFLETKFYLKGETVKQYLDYLELKESREQAKIAQESSTKAIEIAYWSLAVTIIVAIASILTTIFYQPEWPTPPFEVKVIEKPIPIKEQIHIYNNASKSIELDNEKD